jgi:predicted ester cyclase
VGSNPTRRRDLNMEGIFAGLGGIDGSSVALKGVAVQNRMIVERALAAFSDPARREQYFELYAPGIVLHGYEGAGPGIESVRRYYTAFWAAFPDARVMAEDMLEAGDKVIVRFLMTGTHRGPILGLDATGKSVQLAGMTILRFEDQKCVERWSVTDSLALAVQLGAFPCPK